MRGSCVRASVIGLHNCFCRCCACCEARVQTIRDESASWTKVESAAYFVVSDTKSMFLPYMTVCNSVLHTLFRGNPNPRPYLFQNEGGTNHQTTVSFGRSRPDMHSIIASLGVCSCIRCRENRQRNSPRGIWHIPWFFTGRNSCRGSDRIRTGPDSTHEDLITS